MTLHCLLNGIYGNNFNKKSLLFVHFFMIKYTKIKYLYLFTILSLAGLPPFLLFFFKANYIITFIGSVSFYSFMIIFLIYFINMLFYTQVYLYKNYVFDDINFKGVKNITYSKNLIFNIIVILFIMLLGTIFVSDLYFLGTLFLL